jgi:hypothetical protein
MKTIRFLLIVGTLIFIVSQAEGAEWVLFNTDEQDIKVFYDRETLTKLPTGIIKVWTKKEFSDKGRSEYIQWMISERLDAKHYENLSHGLSLNEVNCVSREKRIMAISHHSYDGRVLFSHTYKLQPSENWQPIAPDSIGETFYRAVCPPQKKK